jgi:hypothetical protein
MYQSQNKVPQSSLGEGVTTARAAQGEIITELDSLNAAVERNGNLIETLASRLCPVRRNDPPASSTDSLEQSDPRTSFGGTLRTFTERLEAQNRALVYALDTLELP